MTQEKIKEIIDMLNTLSEYFLSLPDDMLLNINPRDNESLEHGMQFIKEFNFSLSQFSEGAAKIEDQIKKYFSINPEEDEIETETLDKKDDLRIIRELDKTVAHTLTEDFTYKRPFGFVLGNAAYKGLKTWKSLYLKTLTELHSRNAQLFSALPDEENFVSKKGNKLFSRKNGELRVAQKISSGFYVETNLSANHIKKNIIDLLKHFGIETSEMKIYLREDRDAVIQ